MAKHGCALVSPVVISTPLELYADDYPIDGDQVNDFLTNSKHSHRVLIVASFLSIVFHIVILATFSLLKPEIPPAQQLLKHNSHLNLTLISNSKNTISEIKKNDQPIQQPLSKVNSTSTINKDNTSEAQGQQTSTIITTAKTPKKVIFEDIRESFRKNITRYDKPVQAELKQPYIDSFTFGTKHQQAIEDIVKQRQKTRLIEEQNKFRRDNEYFEFQDIGLDHIYTRVNGVCYLIPKHEPFAIVQRDWVAIKRCSEVRKLTFKPGALSYKNKSTDKY